MLKEELIFMAILLSVVACLIAIGFILGYMYVVVNSHAYSVDGGHGLMLEVNGSHYQYCVSSNPCDDVNWLLPDTPASGL